MRESVRAEAREWLRFLSTEGHILREHPSLLFQQAANQPQSTSPARAAHRRLEAGIEKRPWLRRINKPNEREPCLMTITETGAKRVLAASRDGRCVVSDSPNWALRIWNVISGTEIVTLSGHSAHVEVCDFSADGRRLLSCSADRTARIWDIAAGTELFLLVGHQEEVVAGAFAKDGASILTLSENANLKVWDAVTGRELSTRVIDTRSMYRGMFSRNGTRAIARRFQAVVIMDVSTGDDLAVLEGVGEAPATFDFSPDGLWLVGGYDRGTLLLWNARTGAVVHTLASGADPWKLSSEKAPTCTFSADGRTIASGSNDMNVRVWDVATGACLATLRGHDHEVPSCVFLPDGQTLVSAEYDVFKVWEWRLAGKSSREPGHGARISASDYSPDSRRVVSASGDTTLMTWDAESGAHLMTLSGHEGQVNCCRYLVEGSLIVSGATDGVKLWDAQSGQEKTTLTGHAAGIRYCLCSPDDHLLVTGSSDRGVLAWDAATGERAHISRAPGLCSMRRSPSAEVAAALSPDGRRIVTGSHFSSPWPPRDIPVGELRSWDLATGAPLSVMENGGDWVMGCVFSPDGWHLLGATRDGSHRLWSVRAGSQTLVMRGHRRVAACAYSADGRMVASAGGEDRLPSIKVWDPRTGVELASLEGHSWVVEACAFSPDSRYLASASFDGSLKVWDVRTGAPLATCVSRRVGALTWSPAGSSLAAGDHVGAFFILSCLGLEFGPPIVTAVHVYLHSEHQWSRSATARCPWCGRRFAPTSTVVDVIQGLTRNARLEANQSPCSALPSAAWEERTLHSACTRCHQPVVFNPFVVDDRDHY